MIIFTYLQGLDKILCDIIIDGLQHRNHEQAMNVLENINYKLLQQTTDESCPWPSFHQI